MRMMLKKAWEFCKDNCWILKLVLTLFVLVLILFAIMNAV